MYTLIKHYEPSDSLSQYGDGIFETMLATECDIYNWSYHLRRLTDSCSRLGISPPDSSQLYIDIQEALRQEGHDIAVVKMVISRGQGMRGYKSIDTQPCYISIAVSPYVAPQFPVDGLRLRVCQTRLASQPLLAGMKHCNRLEYLMARREQEDKQYDEGLLLDYNDSVIEGLISNIFIMSDMTITTPSLTEAGVAGTMRALLQETLLQHGYSVSTEKLTLSDIERAESVFLTNATHGIMPVATIQGIERTFAHKPVHTLQTILEHPTLCFSYAG